MTERKPCPFCGNTNIGVFAFNIITDAHVSCECGAYMGDFNAPRTEDETDHEHELKSAEMAIAAWNRRTEATK